VSIKVHIVMISFGKVRNNIPTMSL